MAYNQMIFFRFWPESENPPFLSQKLADLELVYGNTGSSFLTDS